jgi:hypothetical protein
LTFATQPRGEIGSECQIRSTSALQIRSLCGAASAISTSLITQLSECSMFHNGPSVPSIGTAANERDSLYMVYPVISNVPSVPAFGVGLLT